MLATIFIGFVYAYYYHTIFAAIANDSDSLWANTNLLWATADGNETSLLYTKFDRSYLPYRQKNRHRGCRKFGYAAVEGSSAVDCRKTNYLLINHSLNGGFPENISHI